MDNKKLLIIGTGQYANVAQEVAASMERYEVIERLDISRNADLVNGNLRSLEPYRTEGYEVVVAVRSHEIRLQLLQKLEGPFKLAREVQSDFDRICHEMVENQNNKLEEYSFETGV